MSMLETSPKILSNASNWRIRMPRNNLRAPGAHRQEGLSKQQHGEGELRSDELQLRLRDTQGEGLVDQGLNTAVLLPSLTDLPQPWCPHSIFQNSFA
mmetsp:Transcript_1848/g.4270  ORF Transcript_1848/g.4270 Transcript_1848/m.4270 type:complete len:97 (-) Transcript_1848:374-664(-)